MAASLMVSQGANVLAVSRQLGHADPSETLNRYAALFDSDLDDVGVSMNKLFSGMSWDCRGESPNPRISAGQKAYYGEFKPHLGHKFTPA